MILTSENVHKIFLYCIAAFDVVEENTIIIEGILNKYKFDKKCIKEKEDNIIDLLSQLPDSFKPSQSKSGGGGMSFLMMCETNEGE